MNSLHEHFHPHGHWGGRPGSAARHVALGLLMGTAFLLVLGTVVMLLWNNLMPHIFGTAHITFWQGLGLLLLCRILVGGFHRGGHGFRRRMQGERWQNYEQWWREKGEASFRDFARGPASSSPGGPEHP